VRPLITPTPAGRFINDLYRFATMLKELRAIEPALAPFAGARVRADAAGTHEVIRIDAAWIAVQPLDMRAG
jgi:hypothetical protein